MKIRIYITTLALILSFSGFGQSSTMLTPTELKTPVIQYTTAYVTQPSSTKQPSIKVVYETGESEVILLEKYTSSEEREAGGKKISETDLDNQIAITSFINKLALKNYALKEVEYDVSSHNSKYTIFIFEKIVLIQK